MICLMSFDEAYLGCEGVVVVLPRELGLDVAAGVQRLQGLDHLYQRVSMCRVRIEGGVLT